MKLETMATLASSAMFTNPTITPSMDSAMFTTPIWPHGLGHVHQADLDSIETRAQLPAPDATHVTDPAEAKPQLSAHGAALAGEQGDVVQIRAPDPGVDVQGRDDAEVEGHRTENISRLAEGPDGAAAGAVPSSPDPLILRHASATPLDCVLDHALGEVPGLELKLASVPAR